MVMTRAGKQEEIESIGQHLGGCQLALCADYRGLTVAQMTQLRRALRESGAVSRVVKNTLAKVSVAQALEQADAAEREKFAKLFEGPSFLIFAAEDPVAPAKVLTNFAKGAPNLEIKGGWFEGSFVDENGIKQLSDLPSKEELYAKLLSLLNAPASQLVRLVQAPAAKLAQLMSAYHAKLEGGES